MSGHIRFDKDLENDPRVLELADRLAHSLQREVAGSDELTPPCNALCNACRNALLGSLVTLWCYADTHIHSDNTLPIKLRHLADVVRLPLDVLQGFPDEWLYVRPDGVVVLPEYVEKNALIAKEKRREQGRERVRRFRDSRNAGSNALHVTQSNARNAPSRAGARARIPVPVPKEEKKPPTPLGRGPDALTRSDRRPRDLRAESARVWEEALVAIDHVRKSTGLTWGYAAEALGQDAHQAVELVGGYKLIADRTQFTQGELKRRFRETYEQLLERKGTEGFETAAATLEGGAL